MHNKSSLVILYHRQPYDEVVVDGKVRFVEKSKPNGIVPTLKGFFSNVPQGTWVAWKQVDPEDRDSFEERVEIDREDGRMVVRRLALDAEDVKSFYHVTAKESFWPVIHSFPSQYSRKDSNWETFCRINKAFADAACEEAADDAVVWVHDYNLWLAPYYLRARKPNLKIGFFHHTPFPAPDIFNILPWRDEIIESLLRCDLVGFHVPRYAENFVATARGLKKGVEVLAREAVTDNFTPVGNALAEPEMTRELRYEGRRVHIDVFPVGTSPERISEMIGRDEAASKIEAIRDVLRPNGADHGRKLILAAGRVDFTKGTKEMLECYERLLERRTELQEQVVLMIVAVAAADGMKIYDEVQAEIEQLAGRINGMYSTFDWQPVILTTNPIPLEELVCYYRAADVCWITPLRDGLNLVAKEYVAAHEGKGDGVLILSEFAGASVELPDAVRVNPWCTEDMDRAIDIGLDMPREERAERMKTLYRDVCKSDIRFWSERVAGFFEQPGYEEDEPVAVPMRAAKGSGGFVPRTDVAIARKVEQ